MMQACVRMFMLYVAFIHIALIHTHAHTHAHTHRHTHTLASKHTNACIKCTLVHGHKHKHTNIQHAHAHAHTCSSARLAPAHALTNAHALTHMCMQTRNLHPSHYTPSRTHASHTHTHTHTHTHNTHTPPRIAMWSCPRSQVSLCSVPANSLTLVSVLLSRVPLAVTHQ